MTAIITKLVKELGDKNKELIKEIDKLSSQNLSF